MFSFEHCGIIKCENPPGDTSGDAGLRPKISEKNAKLHKNRVYIPREAEMPQVCSIQQKREIAIKHSCGDSVSSIDLFDCNCGSNAMLLTCEMKNLICVCNNQVFLCKEDPVSGQWYRIEIVTSLGKATCGCMLAVGTEVFLAFAKLDEILVVRCSSGKEISAPGPLELKQIMQHCVIDIRHSTVSYVDFIMIESELRLIGLVQGHKTALKLWDVSKDRHDEGSGKLLDHKSVASVKTAVGVDHARVEEGVYVVVAGTDGNVELFSAHGSGLSYINRMKIEDSPQAPAVKSPARSHAQMGMDGRHKGMNFKPEFQLLALRLVPVTEELQLRKSVAQEVADEVSEGINQSESNLPAECCGEKDETVRRFHWLPQMVLIAATTTKICLLDVRSGEKLLASSYEDWQGQNLMITSMEIDFDPGTSTVVGLMYLLKDENLNFLTMKLLYSPDDCCCSGFSFTTVSENPKSVLRKKLKCPTPPPSVLKTSAKSVVRNSKDKRNSWAIASRSRSNPSMLQEEVAASGEKRAVTAVIRSAENEPVNVSEPTVCYSRDTLFSFDEQTSTKIPSELAENGISVARMCKSPDGKYLAIGANVSPMVIVKTRPQVESIRMYKDVARVSSVSFAFHSQNILIGSNDCVTTVMDWNKNRETLKLSFSSKFNEHVGSQFYYMDKFILQPEENRLVLYSVSLRETKSVALKAGTFTLECQNITCTEAPNQFFSNYVLCGLSSKALLVYDVDSEKPLVSIQHAHSKPITTIRINEAPRTSLSGTVGNFVLTSAPTSMEPIKLWDFRLSKSIMSVGDVCPTLFVPIARPALSPCGRYIASGLENNTISIYDTRKLSSRVNVIKGLKSAVLDSTFDALSPILWCTCRNGSILSFNGV